MALVIKNPPANIGDIRDMVLVPGLGRSLGEGRGNPLQYSCLENPMDRAAWLATVHRLQRVDTIEAYLACMHEEVSCLFGIIHIFVRNGYYRIRFFFFFNH